MFTKQLIIRIFEAQVRIGGFHANLKRRFVKSISRISIWVDCTRCNRLDADIDDTQQEVEDVAGLVVFAGPVVGIFLYINKV